MLDTTEIVKTAHEVIANDRDHDDYAYSQETVRLARAVLDLIEEREALRVSVRGYAISAQTGCF